MVANDLPDGLRRPTRFAARSGQASRVQVRGASWKRADTETVIRPPNAALSGEPLFRLAAAHSGTPAAALSND